MAEFKQIIGRGTRLREDYDTVWLCRCHETGRRYNADLAL